MKKGQKKKTNTYTRKKIIDEFTELPISRQQNGSFAAPRKADASFAGNRR